MMEAAPDSIHPLGENEFFEDLAFAFGRAERQTRKIFGGEDEETLEDKMINYICRIFNIDVQQFARIRERVTANQETPRLQLHVDSIECKDLHLSSDVGYLECTFCCGQNTFNTRTKVRVNNPVWDEKILVLFSDIFNEKMEIHVNHLYPRDDKDGVTNQFLRTLDSLGQRLRSSIRVPKDGYQTSNIASSVPASPVDERSLGISKGQSPISKSASPMKLFREMSRNASSKITSTEKNAKVNPLKSSHSLDDTMCENLSRTQSLPSFENNWIINTFATLRRSKKKFEQREKCFVDMSSPIPLGSTNTIRKNYKNWRLNMENDNATEENTDNNDYSPNIVPKAELTVQRQLFPRDSKTIRSEMLDSGKFEDIPLQDEADGCVKDRNIISNQFSEKKYGSLKIFHKKEPKDQLKRFSTVKEKHDEKSIIETERKGSLFEGLITSVMEDYEEASLSKQTIGVTKINLSDYLTKMICSEWHLDEKIKLTAKQKVKKKNAQDLNKEQGDINFSVNLSTEPHALEVNGYSCFSICLDRLMNGQTNIQKKTHDFGLFLPLDQISKIILKKISLAYNLPEEHLSLACWSAISHRINNSNNSPAENSSDRRSEVKYKARENIDSPDLSVKRRTAHVFHAIDPEFVFYWFKRLDKSLTSSFDFSENEMRMMKNSINKFLFQDLSSAFQRLHSSFPVGRADHLLWALRCIQLTNESDGITRLFQSEDGKSKFSANDSLFTAVKIHAINWANALRDDCMSSNPRQSLMEKIFSGSNSTEIREVNHQGKSENENESKEIDQNEESCLNVIMKSIDTLRNGEKALLTINDFLILGERVYDPAFRSILDESYMIAIWETIGCLSMSCLQQIIDAVKHLNSSVALRNLHKEDLKEVHSSSWILILQINKLHGFQTRCESSDLSWKLPDDFYQIFVTLKHLWIDICFFIEEENVPVYIEQDSFEIRQKSGGNSYISDSAREMIDFIEVLQEKMIRLEVCLDEKSKIEQLDQLKIKFDNLIKVYRMKSCDRSLEKSGGKNTLTAEMCIVLNNIYNIYESAEKLLSSVSGKRRTDESSILNWKLREDAFYLFSKRLPRFNSWLTNGLKEESLADFSNWIKALLQPPTELGTESCQLLLKYFWDYFITVLNPQYRVHGTPRQYSRVLNFVEQLYMFFKSELKVQISEEAEDEFYSHVDYLKLKGSTTSDLIQSYYKARRKEQEQIKPTNKPLVVNVLFCSGKGLIIGIYMAPFVNANLYLNNDPCSKCVNSTKQKNGEINCHTSGKKSFKKANSWFNLLSRKNHQVPTFYIKTSLVPKEWFVKQKFKKTKCTTQNPPVYDDEFYINSVHPDSEGVKRGGFIHFKLKVNYMKMTKVISEAVLPLQDLPSMEPEFQRTVKHSYLNMDRPGSLTEYQSLTELRSRCNDKIAVDFWRELTETFDD